MDLGRSLVLYSVSNASLCHWSTRQFGREIGRPSSKYWRPLTLWGLLAVTSYVLSSVMNSQERSARENTKICKSSDRLVREAISWFSTSSLCQPSIYGFSSWLLLRAYLRRIGPINKNLIDAINGGTSRAQLLNHRIEIMDAIVTVFSRVVRTLRAVRALWAVWTAGV